MKAGSGDLRLLEAPVFGLEIDARIIMRAGSPPGDDFAFVRIEIDFARFGICFGCGLGGWLSALLEMRCKGIEHELLILVLVRGRAPMNSFRDFQAVIGLGILWFLR